MNAGKKTSVLDMLNSIPISSINPAASATMTLKRNGYGSLNANGKRNFHAKRLNKNQIIQTGVSKFDTRSGAKYPSAKK